MLFCAGCTSTADTTIDLVFDPCGATIVARDATDDELVAIEDAIGLWNEAAALGLSRVDEQAGGAIEIRFEPAAAVFFGLYDDEGGVVWINRSIADRNVLGITIAHEVGHAFGLVHVPLDDGMSVMNPNNTIVPPEQDDVERLRAIWGHCSASDAAQSP